ncbi:hypothetical protein XELAEV_18035606mg [Xenopus laevis]|uniref:Uncharacterized protein n=1 Tax=Xenopus laevis TaxID=8355 RepID=A0A974CFY7_XENLA|nr:hypothetical protein XELAEV_18035606mg [Xenopus laevis]
MRTEQIKLNQGVGQIGKTIGLFASLKMLEEEIKPKKTIFYTLGQSTHGYLRLPVMRKQFIPRDTEKNKLLSRTSVKC